jgi:hypothetical protein
MPENSQVLLSVDCPGCRRNHDIAVPKHWLREKLEEDGDVKLYCITSDASWSMTDQEKRNTRKAFAAGIL